MGIFLASIEGEEIVIRVPIGAIATAAVVSFDEAFGFEQHDFRITDAAVFAPAMVDALNDEEEDGTTPIDKLLDAAVIAAMEAGAEGAEGGEQ